MSEANSSSVAYDKYGHFTDKAREEKFRLDTWPEDQVAITRMAWAGSIMFILGSAIDLGTVGWGTIEFFLSFLIRAFCAIAAARLALVLHRSHSPSQSEVVVFCHEILLITGYIAIVNLAPQALHVQSNVMLAFLVFMWFFIPIPIKYTIASSVIVFLGYFFVHFRHLPDDYTLATAAFLLFSGVSILGFFSARARAKLRRSNAIHEEKLIDANNELLSEVEFRKAAEAQEADAREKFEGLFRASPMPLVLSDNENGAVLNINDACVQMLGIQESDIIGRSHMDFVEASDAYEELNRLVDMKPGTVSAELQIKIGNGTLRDCVVSSVRFGQAGETLVLTGLYDITERKDFERDLITARLEAETAQRVQTEFLATMSHEIRTPLNALLGFLQVIELDESSDPVRSNLSLARQSGEHLLRLITDILDLSKLSAGKIELEPNTVNCQTMCEESLETFALSAQEKGLETNFEVVLPQDCYMFDELRVRQVLFNLLGNAIKFTHSGSVELSLRANPDGSAGRNTLHFEVRDSGIGIEPGKAAVIFQEFTQADTSVTRQFGGTGLGLAISRKLVEAMGGSIGATPHEGNDGTTFWFEIPAQPVSSDGNCCKETTPHTRAPSNEAKQIRVLVAEDNPMNQRVVKAFLSNLGIDCEVVNNGKEAVEILRRQDFSLVLMDIQMPVLDGLSAIRFIRSGATPNPKIPIVALTANAMAGDRESYLNAGADEYLSKPVTLEALDQVIRELAQEPAGELTVAAKN